MNGYTNEVPASNVDYLPHHCSPHKRTGVTSMILQLFVPFVGLLWIMFPFLNKKNAPKSLEPPVQPPKSQPSPGPVVEMYPTHLAAVPMFVSFTHAEIDPRSCWARFQPNSGTQLDPVVGSRWCVSKKNTSCEICYNYLGMSQTKGDFGRNRMF